LRGIYTGGYRLLSPKVENRFHEQVRHVPFSGPFDQRRWVVLKNVRSGIAAAALALVAALCVQGAATAADAPKSDAKVDYTKVSPADLVSKTPKGQIKNPYTDSQADIVADGEKKFLSYSCNGCHGGGGGGGMCPPLINDVWVYEGDDDTLFRLVTLGSEELQKAGYSRHGSENVVGPMPPFGTLIKSSDDLFRILTFIRSKYSPNADPKYKFGTPEDQK
jgi:mono/diheme cytochrome c family protein